MKYTFTNGKSLLDICSAEGIAISEVMIMNEMERSECTREQVIDEMKTNLEVMRNSVNEGLNAEKPLYGKLLGGDAVKLMARAEKSLMGVPMARLVASSMAVAECNASMGKIVAAPTAGASGILPAVLVECGEKQHGFDDETLCRGLFAAGAVGAIIAANSSIAGASGGCQAETGTAAAMAAAALVEMCGGSPETALSAAAIALKNCMGLVCDPVAGLVECPCIKRNAIGVANAVLSADLSLAEIYSLIPFDEVVEVMRSVGDLMVSDLKETARGGIAVSETAKKLEAEVLGAN